jgi:putative ABC transport system permease protein
MKFPLWRRRHDRELDEEIASHLQLAIADRVERGESLEEATHAVRREFGNIGLVKEVTRDMWGWTAIEQAWQDVRYGWRALRKAPGFAGVAIMTFGLGIGVNSAMFSVINAVMLRPLPFPASDRLVDVSEVDNRSATTRSSSASWPDFFDWRSRTRLFEHLSAYHETAVTMIIGGRSVHLPGAVVSADLFSTLDVQPVVGRAFRSEEERAGSDVAVISDTLWRSEFGATGQAVGTTTTINSRPFVIIGVMPAGFRYPISAPAAQVWITAAEDARVDQPGDQPMTAQRAAHFIKVVGRLRPGASLGAVQTEMNGIFAALAHEYPDAHRVDVGVKLTPELDRIVGETRQPLLVLLIAVGCVLVIACANVANLLLVRGASRGHEIALRLALGASRRRIVWQLLTESAVLSTLGTVVGLMLAAASIRVFTGMAPSGIRGLDEVTIDRAVLMFTVVLGCASALAFGTAPALVSSRIPPKLGLDPGTRATASLGHTQLRAALAIAETAIGVVLLVAAGLLLRSFYRLAHTDPGFDASRVVTLRFHLSDSRYSYLKQVAFYDALLADLNARPGVEATAAAPLPLSGSRYSVSFEPPNTPLPASKRPSADFGMAGPGYFRTMQIPLVEGREFTRADDDAAPRAVIVNQSFVRQYLGGRDPIGQRIRPSLSTTEPGTPWREIIGVVSDFKQRSLDEVSRPAYFVPYAQGLITTLFIVIRTARPAAAVVAEARNAVLRKDPELAVYDVRTMDEYVTGSLSTARFHSCSRRWDSTA